MFKYQINYEKLLIDAIAAVFIQKSRILHRSAIKTLINFSRIISVTNSRI